MKIFTMCTSKSLSKIPHYQCKIFKVTFISCSLFQNTTRLPCNLSTIGYKISMLGINICNNVSKLHLALPGNLALALTMTYTLKLYTSEKVINLGLNCFNNITISMLVALNHQSNLLPVYHVETMHHRQTNHM